MKKRFLPYLIATFCVAVVACSKENEQNLTPPVIGVPACDTVNIKLAANVAPILNTYCYNCHGNGRAQGGVKLDVYAELKLWVNSGDLLGAITHATGYSPMPKGGSKLSDCDINKIKAWINRGALNN